MVPEEDPIFQQKSLKALIILYTTATGYPQRYPQRHGMWDDFASYALERTESVLNHSAACSNCESLKASSFVARRANARVGVRTAIRT